MGERDGERAPERERGRERMKVGWGKKESVRGSAA